MSFVSRLPSFKFWDEQIVYGRHDDLQAAISFTLSSRFPIRWHLSKNSCRHEIDMPAMALLKLTAYHRLVTKQSHLLTFRNRIHIHAVFRKRQLKLALSGMPKESPRADQHHASGLCELATPLIEPVFDLAWIF